MKEFTRLFDGDGTIHSFCRTAFFGTLVQSDAGLGTAGGSIRNWSGRRSAMNLWCILCITGLPNRVVVIHLALSRCTFF